MKITLTGSLGNIGSPLAKQLIENGHEVTVISHNPERKKDIEALGAIAAIGSVEDPGFLASKFDGSDAVFVMIPPNYTTSDAIAYYRSVGNSYAHAIKQANVKRVVHLSSWGAHLKEGTGFIVGSHEVEVILDEIPDIQLTHLRPGSFYYNMYSFMDMIKHVGFIGSNYGGEDQIVMVSPYDIADAAVDELTSKTSVKVRYVASEDITGNEVARILGLAIGKPDLKWVTFSDEQTQNGLEQAGVPKYVAKKLVELGASIHNGKMREDYDLHRPEPGQVKMNDFAREFAVAYSKK
nr:NAD(P)H-binding protein [Pedobacter panaciterrae]